jgi:hypothetical protein
MCMTHRELEPVNVPEGFAREAERNGVWMRTGDVADVYTTDAVR